MKIKDEHYRLIKEKIDYIIKKYPNAKEQYTKAGLSDERYRWDLLRATGLKIGDSRGMHGDLNLYDYLNDRHIDTALRKITQTK